MTLTPRLTPTTPPIPSRYSGSISPGLYSHSEPNVWIPAGVSLEEIPIVDPARMSPHEFASPQCKRLHREPSSPHKSSSQCGIAVRVNEQDIAIFRLADDHLFASQLTCPHMGARLIQGGRILTNDIEDFAIECPLHRLRFDLRSGRLLSSGTVDNLKTFPVRIKSGLIEIGFDSMVLITDNF
jgi:nitrite reductase (NADH) small subunit